MVFLNWISLHVQLLLSLWRISCPFRPFDLWRDRFCLCLELHDLHVLSCILHDRVRSVNESDPDGNAAEPSSGIIASGFCELLSRCHRFHSFFFFFSIWAALLNFTSSWAKSNYSLSPECAKCSQWVPLVSYLKLIFFFFFFPCYFFSEVAANLPKTTILIKLNHT